MALHRESRRRSCLWAVCAPSIAPRARSGARLETDPRQYLLNECVKEYWEGTHVVDVVDSSNPKARCQKGLVPPSSHQGRAQHLLEWSGEGGSAVVGSSDLPAKVTFDDKTGWGLGRKRRLSSR